MLAYRIRYDSGGFCRFSGKRDAKTRMILLAVACLGLGLSALLWPDLAERFLAHPPRTQGERAVWALAQTLAEGEGWYVGLVAWCRTVLGV